MSVEIWDDNYWLQHARLRSKRHKKRMQREDEDKALIRKHKEEDALYAKIRNLGWEELKPPVQRGFIRYFVLRGDVARNKDAAFFQKILDKINTRQWSYRKDFKKKVRKFGKKVFRVREQQLGDVFEYDFNKKFNEIERSYFYEHIIHSRKNKVTQKVFRFSEAWRFVLKVQPNMITKVRIQDLDLVQEQAEISKFFNHDRRFRIFKLLHGSNRWKWDSLPKLKYENPLHNKPMVSILEEHWPEPEMKLTTKNPRQNRGFSFYSYLLKWFSQLLQPLRYLIPIHHVPPIGYILVAFVLILEVVCMFPNIER